jgi:DNA-binding GntR family transcriptional regulator
VSRYIRADDAFHRIFFSLLRNPFVFEIYNAMDVPELMRRVLEDAPTSIREVFDNHVGLTDALRDGSARAIGDAITEHANLVRVALAALVAGPVAHNRRAGDPGPLTGASTPHGGDPGREAGPTASTLGMA